MNPYIALETLGRHVRQGQLPPGVDREAAEKNFIKAVHKGVVKVMSKMGISTIQSYRGAQIFEVVGFSQEAGGQVFQLDPNPGGRHRNRCP